jgi:hypothetical protein
MDYFIFLIEIRVKISRTRNILNMFFNVKSVGNINLNLFGILSYKKSVKF